MSHSYKAVAAILVITILACGCDLLPKRHSFNWETSDYGVDHRPTEEKEPLQRKTEK